MRRLHMDNAPSHSSTKTTALLDTLGVKHFRTPAQSPDLNSIELVWHDMKVFIATEAKPNNKNELIQSILHSYQVQGKK